MTCFICYGKGRIDDIPCPDCSGPREFIVSVLVDVVVRAQSATDALGAAWNQKHWENTEVIEVKHAEAI